MTGIRGEFITVIGALTTSGLGALMSIRGGTTKEVFWPYVGEVLAPRRREGDFVVSDNLAAHKDERLRNLIAAKGAKLIFLPPYSPDLYPIELALAWVKGGPSLHTLKMALDPIKPELATVWMRHWDYAVQCP